MAVMHENLKTTGLGYRCGKFFSGSDGKAETWEKTLKIWFDASDDCEYVDPLTILKGLLSSNRWIVLNGLENNRQICLILRNCFEH